MKKKIIGFLVLAMVMVVLGTCATTNTAGLTILDKPIRLGCFYMLVNSNHPLVQTTFSKDAYYNTTRHNFENVYRYMVDVLSVNLSKISEMTEQQTGFPLDVDRFLDEFMGGNDKLIVSSQNTSNTLYGITWLAEKGPNELHKNNEAIVLIGLERRLVEIVKRGKTKSERIYIKFNY